jgi:hypothetical protein
MGTIIDGEGYIIADELIDEEACEDIVHRSNCHDELVAALKHLRNEVTGFMGWEQDLRELVGNTNVSVIIQRLQEADEALAKASQKG